MWIRLLRPRGRFLRVVLPAAFGVFAVLGVGVFAAGRTDSPRTAPTADRYTDLASVVQAVPPDDGPDASTGSYTEDCGRDLDGHRNADNVVISPGVAGSAHHTHEYVGNVSTDAFSSNRSLVEASTTCAGGDRSTYYWPVLRRLDRTGADAHVVGGGIDGNTGEIVTPSSVRVEFRGNPVSKVVAMPRFLRMITGDAVAVVTGDANVRAQWGCAGHPGRFTTKYTLCPRGSGPTRTLDFPSCWNGLATDSPDHRGHVVFPAANGVCPRATFPVPQLRVTLTYDLPHGTRYAVDSFPEQKRDPKTDHAMFIDVMTDGRMNELVRCVNEGRHCRPK
ncbi:DUF1996 domain-containing protein [Streptomyces sp. NPDC096132]|uniref:DUF1996 domain-containing protein n=1 Tax=Streptomyces sp. NPDC096132 TaxID=3366075 RepID=UPI00381B0966